MFTYKNKSPYHYVIPNVGEVDAGGTITSEVELNNPDLELINEPKAEETKPQAPAAPAAPVQAPTVAQVQTPGPAKEATS